VHNNNIIHRDIKPENLVLDEKGIYIGGRGESKNYLKKKDSSELLILGSQD